MSWNPKKHTSPAQRRHIQENLQKIHARQQNLENIPPLALPSNSRVDRSVPRPSLPNTPGAAPQQKRLLEETKQKLVAEQERGEAHRRDLHNTRRRERRARDAKDALQQRLKKAEAEAARKTAEFTRLLREVRVNADSQVSHAQAKTQAAEVRVWEAEARLDGTVDRITAEMAAGKEQVHKAEMCLQESREEVVVLKQAMTAARATLEDTVASTAMALEEGAQTAEAAMAHIYQQTNTLLRTADARTRAAKQRADAAVLQAWEAQARANVAKEAAEEVLEGAGEVVEGMRIELDQRTAQLEVQAQSAVANVLWLAQWGLADFEADASKRIAEAERRAQEIGKNAAATIEQEHLRAEAAILCAETWAEETVEEIKGRLCAAMEDADQYLDYARQL
ncbi:hypothetical protein BC628DRAFT_1302402, partial [Trametes gibbosa]